MRYLVISLTLAASLSACGYKGPLYLPAPAKQAVAHPAASQPTTDVLTHKDASQP